MTGTVCTRAARSGAEEFLQLFERVTARPTDEGFAGFLFCFVNAENFFDERWDFLRGDAFEHLTGDALLGAHSAAHDDVITLAAIGEFRTDETDVAAVVLGARMRAAGEMKVNRRGEVHAIAESLRQCDAVG